MLIPADYSFLIILVFFISSDYFYSLWECYQNERICKARYGKSLVGFSYGGIINRGAYFWYFFYT